MDVLFVSRKRLEISSHRSNSNWATSLFNVSPKLRVVTTASCLWTISPSWTSKRRPKRSARLSRRTVGTMRYARVFLLLNRNCFWITVSKLATTTLRCFKQETVSWLNPPRDKTSLSSETHFFKARGRWAFDLLLEIKTWDSVFCCFFF